MANQQITRRLIAAGAIDESRLDLDLLTGEAFTIARGGATILTVTDAASLQFRKSSTYSPMGIQPSTAPTTVVDGDYYHDSTTKELYYYDSTRAKFLSVKETTEVFNRSQGGAIQVTRAFDHQGLTTADNNFGYIAPRNATIVGIVIYRNSSTGAMDIEIRKNDSAATLVTKTVSSPTVNTSDLALNVNINASDKIQCYCTNNATNGATGVSVQLLLKDRQ